MILQEIFESIIDLFHIDDALEVHILEDKVELFEITYGCDLPDGNTMKDFKGLLCILYIKENKITCIEHPSMHLITSANSKIYEYLLNLINIQITDFEQYDKDITIRCYK